MEDMNELLLEFNFYHNINSDGGLNCGYLFLADSFLNSGSLLLF